MRHSFLSSVPFLAVLLIFLAVYAAFFEQQELSFYDLMMRIRPAKITSKEIVIIEIADDTLKGLGRWPLPRDYHAELIRVLTESGCRMIVFDVMFSEPSDDDDKLTEAMINSGKVYLPYAFRLEQKPEREGSVPLSKEILGGIAQFLRPSVSGIGHINAYVDKDGKVRRIPVLISHAGKLWPSLGLLAAAQSLGINPDKINLRQGILSLGGKRDIPLDEMSGMWVNYPGRWTDTFQHFSYLDVLKAHVARQKKTDSWLDLAVFKDKICFVGLTATGTSDFRANPIDPIYPMIGTQASICDSALRNDFIKRLSHFLRSLIASCVFLTALWLCLRLSPWSSLLSCGILAAAYSLAVWGLFVLRGIFIDIFLPLTTIASVYSVVLFNKFFQEVQKRRLLEKELEIAADIQRSFLPADMRGLGDMRIRSFLKPAKFVGGDFYDIVVLDNDTLGFFIGDVSGKGVSASLIMAQAISLFRVLARNSRDPVEVLSSLNNQLRPVLKGRFVTGQYIVVSLKENCFEGSSAGHPALLFLKKASGSLEELLPSSGPPLGLVEPVTYSRARHDFEKGDKLVMYTDGWTESRDTKNREFGISRFKDVFLSCRSDNPDAVLSRLESSQREFQGRASQHDDLTAVILEF